MFLSLYASFRWAGTENYVWKIVIFVMVASLLSAQVMTVLFGALGLGDWGLLSMVLGGFLNLSFPFSYNLFDEGRILLPPPHNSSQWLRTYEIRVPTTSILQLVPQGPVERSLSDAGWIRVLNYRVILLNTEIGSIPPDATYAIGTLFSFFLLANVAGALLGFLMSKAPLDKIQISERHDGHAIGLFARILIGAAFVVAGIWFSTIGKVILTGSVSQFYASYNPSLYVGDAVACLMFGIVWLATNIVEEEMV